MGLGQIFFVARVGLGQQPLDWERFPQKSQIFQFFSPRVKKNIVGLGLVMGPGQKFLAQTHHQTYT